MSAVAAASKSAIAVVAKSCALLAASLAADATSPVRISSKAIVVLRSNTGRKTYERSFGSRVAEGWYQPPAQMAFASLKASDLEAYSPSTFAPGALDLA